MDNNQQLVWVRESRGFFRSKCGRFDLMDAGGEWVVYDHDMGNRFAGTEEACKAWCELRHGQARAA